MNLQRVRDLLMQSGGADWWLLVADTAETTTVIRMPWIFSVRNGTVVHEPSPGPREVIFAPAETVTLRLFHRFSADGGEWLGDAVGQLQSDSESAVRELLTTLAAAAGTQHNLPFPLPGSDEPYPAVAIADDSLVGLDHTGLTERVQRFGDEVIAAAARYDDVVVSNIELFVRRGVTRLLTAAGVELEVPATRVDLELCFVARPPDRPSAEHTLRRSARRLSDFDPVALVEEGVGAARAIAHARGPVSWQGPVVLLGEACHDALTIGRTPLSFHSRAQTVFENASRHRPDQWLTGDTAPAGEPLEVASDPTLPLGLASTPFTPVDASACRRAVLVRRGRWAELLGERRHFAYLGLLEKGIRPTGAVGNTVIPAGQTALDELLAGECVVVRAFSDWSVEPTSGDFACEVRLGELRRGGECQPFRGGLLVGNWFSAVGDARYSRETQILNSYHGPRAVRFGNLTLAG